jgi:hypothetical protein
LYTKEAHKRRATTYKDGERAEKTIAEREARGARRKKARVIGLRGKQFLVLEEQNKHHTNPEVMNAGALGSLFKRLWHATDTVILLDCA